MKTILIALLLCAATFAVGIEEAIAGYYAASKSEDIESFMSRVDTSNRSASEIEYEREMALGIWDAYDTEEYRISGLEYHVDPSGEYAMAAYSLNATVSGAENFNFESDYVMLLHRVGGTWTVAYVMPYEEYLNMSEQGRYLMAIDYLSEEQYRLVSEPLEPAEPTFDGSAPQDLSDEISTAVLECGSDAYCTANGLGNSCVRGFCSDASSEEGICGPAFILSLLAFSAPFFRGCQRSRPWGILRNKNS
jgi:hypothetical protein